MNFSLQTPVPPSDAPAPTRDLPPLERPEESQSGSPRRRGGLPKLPLLLGLIVAGAGVALATDAYGFRKLTGLSSFFATAYDGVLWYPVTKTSIPVTVVERGQLESGKALDVQSEVEGNNQIISIVNQGTPVKKGDLVAELDSATLKDNLTTQTISTRKAEAEFKQAKLTLEVNLIAVNEYEKGTFPQEIQTAEGELALANSDMARARDRLSWSEGMLKNKLLSEAQFLADKYSLQKAEFSKKQAETKIEVLKKYTRDKDLTEFLADVKKAESDVFAKQQTYELELSKEKKLVTQISRCKLLAPNDGLVVYSNEQSMRPGQQGPQIELGATVRERQKVFSIPDISNMRVNVKVHESMLDRVKETLPSKIKVESFAEKELHGKVISVAPMPDQNGMFSSGINVYTTLVSIDNGIPNLRPGMSAEVTILVSQKDDVLAVPVQAIVQFKGKNYVYIKSAAAPVRKTVTLGVTNDALIEVKEGLAANDKVALNPVALMTQAEKDEAFSVTVQPTSTQVWSGSDAGAAKSATSAAPSKGAGGGPDGAPGGAGGTPRKRGGRGGAGMDPALMERMKNASPEEKAKIREEMKARFGGGGGPGGGGGFGGPPGGEGGFGGPRGAGGRGGEGGGPDQ